MATTAASAIPMATAARGQRFYVRMATTCLAVGVIGFAPTYWVPMVRRTLDVSPLTHLHALFFYGWLLLFLRQTALAASGRLTHHRELGVAGVALATGLFFVGLGMAIGSLKRLEAAGAGDPARAFSIVSFSAIALFAALFAAAIVNVKKPEVHKRLMLVATVSMLQAAIGRWFLLFLAPRSAALSGPPAVPPVFVSVFPGLVTDLLILTAMVHDRRTRGRVHPAYWYGGACVLAVQLLRVPLSTTSAWMRLTHWLIALSP